MSNNLNNLKTLLDIALNDTAQDGLLNLYLQMAEQKVLNKLYPYSKKSNPPDVFIDCEKVTQLEIEHDSEPDSNVPTKYSSIVVSIAQYLYLRRGSEGQKSHSENGISRSYESADIPDSMLEDITPMVGGVL